MCEAFDWFRSYQGGVYHSDHAVKGYLLSAFASKSVVPCQLYPLKLDNLTCFRRDVFEDGGRLIISHGYAIASFIY